MSTSRLVMYRLLGQRVAQVPHPGQPACSNTEDNDSGSNCTLAANQITLAAGTYRVQATAPAYNVDQHQIQLQNITDGTTAVLGQNANAVYDATYPTQTCAHLSGEFTIASAKTFELQHKCNRAIANGLGTPTAWGDEVYTVVELNKVG